MKELALIGANCQGAPLGEALLEHKGFAERYEVITRPNFTDFVEQADDTDAMFREVDLYIYQPISEEFHYNIQPVKRDLLKEGCRTVSFPVMYFSGYWPDAIVDTKRKAPVRRDVFFYRHSKLEEIISQTDDIDEIIRRVKSENLFNAYQAMSNVAVSLAELSKREAELDIKVSMFIGAHYAASQLFHTPNHPSNMMTAFVADEILKALGYDMSQHDPARKPERLGTYQMLIYPSVAKHLGLQFADGSPTQLCNPATYADKYPDIPRTVTIDEYVRWFMRVDKVNTEDK